MRIPRLNLSRDSFDVVASHVRSAISGESGAFHVYVGTDGTVRVMCKAHKKLPAKDDHRATYGELVGTYIASTPLEYIEDDLLEMKRRLHATNAAVTA